MSKMPPAGRTLLVLGVLLFLYLTTYSLPNMAAIEWVQAIDAYSYLAIAKAAPSFPSELLPYHFSQRWLPHYLVGLLAKLLAIDVGDAYAGTSFALCLLIFWLSLDTVLRVFKEVRIAVFAFLFIALSPFSFRLVIFVPELLADLVFVLGLAVTLRALFIGRLGWVIAGMVIATIGKQMSLLILPGVLLYTWCRFNDGTGSKRAIFSSIGVAFGTVGTYLWLGESAVGFAHPNSITSSVLFAIFPWLLSTSFSSSLFAEHLFRIFIPLAPLIGVLLLAQQKLTSANDAGGKVLLRKIISPKSLALLLMLLGPMAYAFLPGPQVQMGNQSRYIALAFLPSALLLARLLPDIRLQLNMRDFLMLGPLLSVFSYHHRYTLLQATPPLFLLVHFVTLLGLLLWFARRLSLQPEHPAGG